MKIRADKIDEGPRHCLNAQDVRLILAAVPPEWTKGLVEVRLANAPGPRAYLMQSEGRLKYLFTLRDGEADFDRNSISARRALVEHHECRSA